MCHPPVKSGGYFVSETGATASSGLWRHADFLKLWAAQSVSSLGARITREGLAYAAVASLGVTPLQTGILAALVRGPAIVVGLTGGGFVDRGRRRPILIGADIGRALVLATVPIAAWSHRLGMNQIYAVAALVGALSVLFDIADHAYLPSLIAREQLVDGNSKLAITESFAEIGGPALYGVLFQLFTAPMAIAVNAGTYVFSAVALATIRSREPPVPPHVTETPANLVGDFRLGVAAALAERSVRALLAIVTASALFGSFFSALYIFFAVRTLHLSPTMLGATVATGGVAALFGAGLASRLVRRFGMGPTFVVTGLVAGAGSIFVPLAHGAPVVGMLMLMVAQAIGDSVGTVTEICGRSLRQSLVQPHLMGRVGGVFAVAPGITGIIGAVLGGWLGGVIGAQHALLIAAAGVTLAPAIGLFSPLLRLRDTELALEEP
jgi:Na+/melibiose symporter-like transporter